MTPALVHWLRLYQRYRDSALALDIETETFNGPVAIVSLCRQRESCCRELIHFIKKDSFNAQALQHELRQCRLLLTFNGLEFDLPRLQAEFPEAIPDDILVFDLYLFAKGLGLRGGLKILEKVFQIQRTKRSESATGQTHRLWRQFIHEKDPKALEILLSYAASDVRNLFLLADTLTEWAEAKLTLAHTKDNRLLRNPNARPFHPLPLNSKGMIRRSN